MSLPRLLATAVPEEYTIDCSKIGSLPKLTVTLGGHEFDLEGKDYTINAGGQYLFAFMPIDVPEVLISAALLACAQAGLVRVPIQKTVSLKTLAERMAEKTGQSLMELGARCQDRPLCRTATFRTLSTSVQSRLW